MHLKRSSVWENSPSAMRRAYGNPSMACRTMRACSAVIVEESATMFETCKHDRWRARSVQAALSAVMDVGAFAGGVTVQIRTLAERCASSGEIQRGRH